MRTTFFYEIKIVVSHFRTRETAWKYDEANASTAPGLGLGGNLGAPSKVSHRCEDFPLEVPFAK